MPRGQSLSFAIRCRRPATKQRSFLQQNSCQLSSASLRNALSNTQPGFLSVRCPKPSSHRRHLSSHTTYRPQAPFLDSHVYRDPSLPARIARFIKIRYLSTARKKRFKETLRWQLRFQAYFWPMAALLATVLIGIEQIETEHEFPTPPEWSLWARWEGRNGQRLLERSRRRGWLSDDGWTATAEYFLKLLRRLEDPKGDGKGTKVQDADGIGNTIADGVSTMGLDLSGKSETWRQGYWDAMMGLAKVAEQLDGFCKRKGEKLSKAKFFKWENIPGPQNPRPVPVPWNSKGTHLNVPAWNEVEAVLTSPEVLYKKILASKGFTNKQRLDAALACADWYEYKGSKAEAAKMYDCALDIAARGLPEGSNNVVDMQTGVINAGKEALVSENLFKATTALGVWHARNGEVKEALPIFLSVLRARKTLPAAPVWLSETNSSRKMMTRAEREAQTGTSVMMGWFGHFVNFFKEGNMLRVGNTGDERPFHTLKEACEEVGLMTYIGEILFATSENEREKGLSWTRDSVEAAEAVLWVMDESGFDVDSEGRQRCRECLETGLTNWQLMIKRMTELAKTKQQEAQQAKTWLGLGLGQGSAIDKAIAEVKRWEEEGAQVELRRQKNATLLNPLRFTGSPYEMNATF